MGAVELLEELQSCGISVSLDQDELVLRPGSQVPPDLLAEIREHKAQILEFLSIRSMHPATPCCCDPLPSQAEFGAMAQAGCGPKYERCNVCGYMWQCKVCGGCRRCRTPG